MRSCTSAKFDVLFNVSKLENLSVSWKLKLNEL